MSAMRMDFKNMKVNFVVDIIELIKKYSDDPDYTPRKVYLG